MSRTAAVIKPQGVAPFLIASLARRTAIAAICDSNGDQVSVTGWNDGMRRAASFLLGCYGTGVLPGGGDGGYAAGLLEVTDNYVNGQAGAPAEMLAYCFPGGTGGPETADWFASGWAANSTLGALLIRGTHPMDTLRSLRFHTKIWRPQSGGITRLDPNIFGSGVGTVLYPGSPANVALPAVAPTGIYDFTFDVPEGALIDFAAPANPLGDGRGWNYREQRWNGAGGTDITGQVGILWRQCEDLGTYRGIQWTKFTTNGGVSTRVPATNICNAYTDQALAEWFRTHAEVQVDSSRRALKPVMMIQIIEGGNDAGETGSSVVYRRGGGFGSATTTGNPLGNTKAGFKNNVQSIINRLRDVWVRTCGYDEGDLYFLLGPYHPQPSTQTQYTFTRTTVVDAFTELCNENDNVSAMDGYKLESIEVFTFAHEYEPLSGTRTTPVTDTFYRDPATDVAHLNQNAYRHFGLCAYRALLDSALNLTAGGQGLKTRIVDARSGATLVDTR